ncbi:Ataxin-2, partial [Pseudolycoriella hygida]
MMKRKTKTRSRPQRERSVTTEGIYNNVDFVHAATSNIGNEVLVQVKSGETYEGVFKTFSSEFEVVLGMAHKVEALPDGRSISVPACAEDIIFNASDIVLITARGIDADYASTFATDSTISRCNGSARSEEKELQPWEAINGELDCSLDCILSDNNSNGWDANDMFNKNELMYDVKSTFDPSLTGYTTQLQHDKDFKDNEKRAEIIAAEIESQKNYKERLDLENGDEEARYAAVERSPSANNSSHGAKEEYPVTKSKKYIGRGRRKNHPSGKLVWNTPPPPIKNNHPARVQSPRQSVPLPKINNYPTMPIPIQSQHGAPPPQYVQQPYFHNDYSQPPPNMSVVTPMLNGNDNNNASTNNTVLNKGPMAPGIRNFILAPSPPVGFTEPPPQLWPNILSYMTMPPPIHGQHAQVVPHMPAVIQAQDASQPSHVLVPPWMVPPHPPMVQQALARPQRMGQRSPPKSTLNPNATPFTPRNPSTPNPSRPHTPQTPQQSLPQGTYPQPQYIQRQMMVSAATYIMPQPAAFQAPQQSHAGQQQRFRKGNNYASQMQVAAAAGQPLLAPAPIQQFVQFPMQPTQHFQSQGYPQMVYNQLRMFNQPTPQPLPYLPPMPPSTTPSPAATYIMPQPAAFQAPQQSHAGQQQRFRKGNNYASQMQVAAAAGQPLLAPAPIQQFVQFPMQPTQHFQSQGYPQMVYNQLRMFNQPTPQPLPYLPPMPPSTTPSPGQPHQQHQQYHLQPSPAGGGPQYAQTTTQAPFQMINGQ